MKIFAGPFVNRSHINLVGLVFRGEIGRLADVPSGATYHDAYYVRSEDVTIFCRLPRVLWPRFTNEGFGVLGGHVFRDLRDAMLPGVCR